ncbi:MAG: Na/Pi cotransporter family protein [Thermaurantimonas sp.]|uniref:Na/Pi cotransporter family protein n=1 Tax=Thermaurantimonas sp. TaxID=2681568 RepID=UPI0039187D38
MNITLIILNLLGGLAIFIYGMKVLSEGLQKVAGLRFRKVLNFMTKSRILGVFSGALATILVQSSSATTVMIVGFSSAGVISLFQSIPLIMGANIGTTLTAWIISYLGLGTFNLIDYAYILSIPGVIMLFFKTKKIRYYGEMIVGLSLFFVGLKFMQNNTILIESTTEFFEWISLYDINLNFTLQNLFLILFFIFIGVLLSIFLQSSTAAIAVTIIFASENLITFPIAAAIVLGENIGTTTTANLAALLANIQGKRAAIAHTIFNVIGVFWAILFFVPLINISTEITHFITGITPFDSSEGLVKGIPIFHSLFNITNTILLLPFIDQIQKLCLKIYPSKTEDEQTEIEFISNYIVGTPSLNYLEAEKEIYKYAVNAEKSFVLLSEIMNEIESETFEKKFEKILDYENKTDRASVKFTEFLLKVNGQDAGAEISILIRKMLSVVSYLERITDLTLRIAVNFRRKKENKMFFTPKQRNDILQLMMLVERSFEVMKDSVYSFEKSEEKLMDSEQIELQINDLYKDFRANYLKDISNNQMNTQVGLLYLDVVNDLERIGDHLESIVLVINGLKM